MSVSAKICGLSTAASVEAALRHGASHLGFVFFAKSPRDVAPERVRDFPRREGVARVGVFVAPDDALLDHAVTVGALDAIQLHGDEPPERVAAVKARFGVPVWKAIPVRTRANLDAAQRYRGTADRLLYDAKPPAGAEMPGGLGLRFDWRLLANGPGGFDHPMPWALSGGLDADTLAEAVHITGARLVDVSSGVESAPGVKAVDKIAAFLQSAAAL